MPRPDSSRREVVEMFDRISPTYDLLNRVFSLGVDRCWRSRAIRALGLRPGAQLLDCSAGTGDMALRALRECAAVEPVLYDPAREMLVRAGTKLRRASQDRGRLTQGVAEAIPFPDGIFDHFTVAFGIRNFSDLARGLAELHRTLRTDGVGVILEFTPDRSALIDRLFRTYMWAVMRPLGALISRDRKAYGYLARTVAGFPVTSRLTDLFRQVGFREVKATPLSLGIATQFLLRK